MSDPVAAPAPLEERMGDVRAVKLGLSEGGAMSVLFAASYPDRTHALNNLLPTVARKQRQEVGTFGIGSAGLAARRDGA